MEGRGRTKGRGRGDWRRKGGIGKGEEGGSWGIAPWLLGVRRPCLLYHSRHNGSDRHIR